MKKLRHGRKEIEEENLQVPAWELSVFHVFETHGGSVLTETVWDLLGLVALVRLACRLEAPGAWSWLGERLKFSQSPNFRQQLNNAKVGSLISRPYSQLAAGRQT